MPFSERDGRPLRRVQGIALERLCAQVFDEAATIARDGHGSAHEWHLHLSRLPHERDAAMAATFDGLLRSTGLRRLPSWSVSRY